MTAHDILFKIVSPLATQCSVAALFHRSCVTSIISNHATPSPATSIPETILSISSAVGSVVGRICICYGS